MTYEASLKINQENYIYINFYPSFIFLDCFHSHHHHHKSKASLFKRNLCLLKNAIKALFLKSSTLIHLTTYAEVHPNWIKIEVSQQQLSTLNNYIEKSFYKNAESKKVILPNKGYSYNDNFYKATGNYTCFFTCNTWVNSAFKEAKLKGCLWTPFDFGLMNSILIEKRFIS